MSSRCLSEHNSWVNCARRNTTVEFTVSISGWLFMSQLCSSQHGWWVYCACLNTTVELTVPVGTRLLSSLCPSQDDCSWVSCVRLSMADEFTVPVLTQSTLKALSEWPCIHRCTSIRWYTFETFLSLLFGRKLWLWGIKQRLCCFYLCFSVHSHVRIHCLKQVRQRTNTWEYAQQHARENKLSGSAASKYQTNGFCLWKP